MSNQTIGMLLGGLMPAILFGLSAVLQKVSAKAGIGAGLFLVSVGVGVLVIGALYFLHSPEKLYSARSISYSVALGVIWGAATIGIFLAIGVYGIPLGKLVPLYNMNTLVAVVLALFIFSEWKEVETPKLILGSLLILLGGTLVVQS